MDEEKCDKFYPKLQKTVSGTYFVTVRKEIIDANGWKENDSMEAYLKKKD